MKLFLLSAFLLAGIGSLHAQTTIPLEDAAKHVGDSVKVCGKVFGGRYLENATNTPTLLNLGAAYPDQLLTVVFWGDTRKQFTGEPEKDLVQKEVCVTGTITIYKDKPQIAIHNAAQLKAQ